MPTKKKYNKVEGKKDTYTKKGSPLEALGVVRFAKAITGSSSKTIKADGYTGASKPDAKRRKK